ncbi:MAG: hypothetical protein JO168_11535 [Solirubrobacterales bacterium]|nr:hypothetical protein [Solirubrobacterales bacterium]MBV9716529.1 hypothetical protein [Solirubrobacterales bacterium]
MKRALSGAAAATALLAVSAVPASAAAPVGAYTIKGAWSYVSAPKLHPPKLHTDRPTASAQLSPGYLFVSNFKNLLYSKPLTGEGGPLILDSRLQPVWFDPIGTNTFANNLRVQTYQGKPALSWWEGIITNTGATTSGSLYVVDQHYRPIGKPLSGADGWIITQHEALIQGHDAWVTAVKNEPMDLSAYGGSPTGTLLNSAVQEYDLHTGALLYTWDAAPDGIQPGHIPLSDSYTKPAPNPAMPWDAYHINAIQLVRGGFITTMRNTWSAYDVDLKSGATVWTLGGKHSKFALSAGAQFEWEHDVEMHSGGIVTVFDDNCCAILGPGQLGPPNGSARALVIKLNNGNHTASLVSQYSRGIDVGFQGNAQLQPNGDMVVGWGSQPLISEFSKSGKLLLDAVFPSPDLSYRAYVAKWVGTPFFPPTGAARNHNGRSTVYASWDGATQVVAWRVLAGAGARQLRVVAGRSKTGFETSIALSTRYKTFKVQALDAKGHVIGTSKAFAVPRPNAKQNPPGFY